MGSRWGHPSPGALFAPCPWTCSHAAPHQYFPVIVPTSTLLPPLQHLQVKITACGGVEKCQGSNSSHKSVSDSFLHLHPNPSL